MSILDVLIRILIAAVLGGVIGLEREIREHTAGFRTHILVAVGAAAFTLASAYGLEGSTFDPNRISAQVVTGIGFLGAGAILRHGASVRGLTTAASLWTVAAVGLLTMLRFTLLMVTGLALVVAIGNGLAKIAADAAIQERIDERVRASAFAHSETILMFAWVGGSALGLAPIQGRIGVGIAAGFAVLAAARAVLVAGRLRHEKLSGRSRVPEATAQPAPRPSPKSGSRPSSRPTPASASQDPAPPPPADDPPPGFHIYRPSAADPQNGPRPTWPEPGSR